MYLQAGNWVCCNSRYEHDAYGLVEPLVLGYAVAETSRVCVIIGLAGRGDGVGMRAEACCDEDGGDLYPLPLA